ncbi:MAG: thiamine pyrophosphate-requiring protein, partial [Chloroflexota bacterium]
APYHTELWLDKSGPSPREPRPRGRGSPFPHGKLISGGSLVQGAQAIASILKTEGAEYLFCFPNNHVIEAAAQAGIKPIMARTERAAIGMTDGYARVSNGKKVAVCAVQLGPGIENSFGAIAQAYSDSTPLLVLAAGVNQKRQGLQPNFDAVLNYQHITKWVARVNYAERIPEFLRRAFTYLRAGRPGPVVLEVPQDVATAEVGEFQYRPARGARGLADPVVVAEAVRAIARAERPIIHAGLGVLYAEAWDELREFAELLQAPVMTTLPGKSAFPEDHPLSLGSGGRTGPLMAGRFLKESDLIFAVGSSMSISQYAAPLPGGKVAVQATVDERDLNKSYDLDYPLLGDAKLVLRQMCEAARQLLGPEGRRGQGRVAESIARLRVEWLGVWRPRLESNETPINPYRAIAELQAALDLRQTIATHDSGNPRDQMVPFWQALAPNSYIGWGKSTHLGYGLPLALGAKLACPEKTVVNVMGDAAFGQNGMDVETAARNGIGTLTVILNNACLGGYDKHMPVASERFRTRFLSGDYTKVAEGQGAYAERVEQASEIKSAVARALEHTRRGRPAVLELITREESEFSLYWK